MTDRQAAAARRARGTGPGAITADGCAVEFYSLLPPANEAEIVHAAIPPRASVLELGAGAGRVTGRLAALGHPVVAVDDSLDMLARIGDAETACARIEELRLHRRFDCVVLGSHLVNTPFPQQRQAFLTTCRRHVVDTGVVLIEQHTPAFFDRPRTGGQESGGISRMLTRAERITPDLVEATVEYRVGDRHWTQTFTARRVDAAELGPAGLRFGDFLTTDHTWFSAVPAHAGSDAGTNDLE